MRILRLLTATALLSLTLGAAHAASLVIGGGDAEACYKAALHDASDLASLTQCGRALDQEALTPKDRASTYINRGVILVQRKAFTEAIADFDQALRLQPRMGEAYLNRGAAKLGLRHYAEALPDLDRAIDLGASQPEKAWFD